MLCALAGLAVLGLAAAAPVATGAPADGKRIAFVRDGDIWTMKPDGSDPHDTGQAGSQPAMSTDGQKIAFTSGGAISVMTPDGTVTGAAVVPGGENPAWSPDGTKLVYDTGSSVVVSNADGSSPTTLDTGTEPAWSPDGTTIAYVKGSDIYAIPLAGGAGVNLTNSSSTNTEPQWSPDSSEIAFVSTRDSALGEIYTMTASGASQTRLTSDASTETSPSWSPDGDSIVYSQNDSGAPTASEIYLIPATGGLTQRLTTNANADTAPDWGTSVANLTAPTIAPDSSGVVEDGRTLIKASDGTWVADTQPTFTYQWQRCTSGGGGTSCTNIAGATAASYPITSADVGATIRLVVTGNSVDGQNSAPSNALGPVTAAAPRNTAPPTVSGVESVGSTLTASTGTWLGTTPMTFSYQWRRCDTNGANCGNIGGATLASYQLTETDANTKLRVRVVATNGVGNSAPVDSLPTDLILSDKPTNSVRPSISGVPAAVGRSLTAVTGTWSGDPFPILTIQWLRCNATGGSCVNITGALSFFYLVTDADTGSTLRVAVTGTNSLAVTTVMSDATNVIPATPPVNVSNPFVSGTAQSGQVLTANTGTWTGTAPLTYTFRWQRCDPNGNCTDIAGATGSTYVLVKADVGDTILVYVTAANALGSVTESTDQTEVVTAAGGGGGGGGGGGTGHPPSILTPPMVIGRLGKGAKLSATAGMWSGTRPLTYTYKWQRCTDASARCTTIAGATKQTYAPDAADVGKTIRVAVTAKNKTGSGLASSDPSSSVAAKKGVVNRLLRGTNKADHLSGGPGNDMILGKGGNDKLAGNGGADQIFGNAGNDTISGGAGPDWIYGGDGNDTINVAGGGRDTVDCGAGTDTVHADRSDVLVGCEKVVYG